MISPLINFFQMDKRSLFAAIFSLLALCLLGQNCPSSANVQVADTTSNSVTLTWSPVAGMPEYNWHLTVCAPPFQMENATQDTFITFPVGNPTYLEPCACHRFKVHIVCPDGSWAYSPEITFQTPCAVATQELFVGNWRIFPNPVRQNMLHITGPELPERVILRDVSGRIASMPVHVAVEEITLQTDGLASGFYFLEMTKTGRSFFEKILIAR